MKTISSLFFITLLYSFGSPNMDFLSLTKKDVGCECFEVAIDMYTNFVKDGIDIDRAIEISSGYYDLCTTGYFENKNE